MNLDERMKAQAENILPDAFLKEKTARLMEAAGTQEPVRESRRKAPRLAPVLAAVMLLVLVGGGIAYASGLLPGVNEAFGRLFGMGQAQTEIIEEMSEPTAVRCVRGGICVEATAQLLDQKVVAVQLKLSREDGSPLIPADAEGPTDISLGSIGYSTNKFDFFGRTDYTDGALPFYKTSYYPVEYFLPCHPGETEAYGYLFFSKTTDKEVAVLDLNMNGLRVKYDGKGHFLSDADQAIFEAGNGKTYTMFYLNIPIQSSEEGRVLASGEEFSANGFDFRIDGIYVSPMSVYVQYSPETKVSDHAVYYYETGEDGEQRLKEIDYVEDPFWRDIDLKLRLKDGRVIDMSIWGMGYPDDPIINPMGVISEDADTDMFIVHRGAVLPEIIPYELMDCVILCGIEYPVN